MLPQIKTILYATDLEDKGARNAFRMAVSLARAHGARIVMLHGLESVSAAVNGMLRNAMSEAEYERLRTSGIEKLKQDLQDKVAAFCREECPEGEPNWPAGEPIIEVMEGVIYEVILDSAQRHEADLIVMGTRTHSAIGQLVLGSTANKIIHHSKVPVLVYPL
ncbi:MAG TPA: universal stress protein [Gammaproteobacteria bacterium]|jgi:nucleotide-binding universal stress UspA family protein|nr:universal stress protein [Gammaproteobacteria bacterium]